MTKPKKFKVGKQLIARFTVCVEPPLYNKLTSIARRRNMSRSELVREIVLKQLDMTDGRKQSPAEEQDDARV